MAVHLRSLILGFREYKTNPSAVVNQQYSECAAKWATALGVSLVYIAADNSGLIYELEQIIGKLLPAKTTFLNRTHLKSYAGASLRNNEDKARFEKNFDIAESLVLGRGNLCIWTPRSTFSMIPSTYW